MDADIEISKPGESSFGAAAKDVKITTTIDTLVKAMLIFDCEGEAGISMFPVDSRIILKELLKTVNKAGLFDLDIAEAELCEKVGKELLKVKKLELPHNKIVDVSPLAGLVNLKELYLYGNQIVDVSPLAGLVHLTYLHLAGNQIVDVSPLAGLVNLGRLILHDNQIVDVSPLAGLVHLTWLQLERNQIVDVSPLAGLVNLGTLWLAGNKIVDTSPLRSLPRCTCIHGIVVAKERADGVEITTIDTLVKAILIFHHTGEQACIGMFPQDGRGAVNILKKLLKIIKQSKTGFLALINHVKDMMGKELLKIVKLDLYRNKIVDV